MDKWLSSADIRPDWRSRLRILFGRKIRVWIRHNGPADKVVAHVGADKIDCQFYPAAGPTKQ